MTSEPAIAFCAGKWRFRVCHLPRIQANFFSSGDDILCILWIFNLWINTPWKFEQMVIQFKVVYMRRNAIMPDKNSVYAEWYQLYYRNLVKYCISKKFREDTAEDIASGVFARAVEKESKFLTLAPAQQRSWLFSAADFVVKEHHDRRAETPFSEIVNKMLKWQKTCNNRPKTPI